MIERKFGIVDTLLVLGVAAAALGFMLRLTPWHRPVVLDPATWDFMSISLAHGLMPYRDIFLHKTPGGALVGAFGAWAGSGLGLTPIQGAHAVFCLLGAAGPTLLFLLLRPRAGRAIALAAAAFMLAFDAWPLAAIEGVRPKVATTVFGLLALLCGQRRLWAGAGVLAGASILCWQPGLAYLVGIAWQSRQLPRREFSRALLALAAGALLPALALLGWLIAIGAFEDFLAQAIGFNFHYISLHARTPLATARDILLTVLDWNRLELALLPIALAGVIRSPRYLEPGLACSGIVYLAMTFVSFQAWPDTILFAPPLAALLAGGLAGLFAGWRYDGAANAAVCLLAFALAATPSAARLTTPITYEEQAAFMHRLENGLSANDRVLVVSLPEFLIHTGRRSIWKWPYLWFGVDRFAAATTDGGFDRLLSDLSADPPALMLIARRWSGPLRQRFDEWARDRYTRERVFFYPHTVRPINVYRRTVPAAR